MDAKQKVERIRSRFPFPVSGYDRSYIVPCYCVGGAYLMFNGYLPYSGDVFPSTKEISYALVVETDKTRDICALHAANITHYNDEGKFEEAWEELEKALS